MWVFPRVRFVRWSFSRCSEEGVCGGNGRHCSASERENESEREVKQCRCGVLNLNFEK